MPARYHQEFREDVVQVLWSRADDGVESHSVVRRGGLMSVSGEGAVTVSSVE